MWATQSAAQTVRSVFADRLDAPSLSTGENEYESIIASVTARSIAPKGDAQVAEHRRGRHLLGARRGRHAARIRNRKGFLGRRTIRHGTEAECRAIADRQRSRSGTRTG